MIRYHPIDIGLPFDGSRSELFSFDWLNTTAKFVMPEDNESLLHIIFDGGVIIRVQDEMPLSTETDPSTWHGLVPRHFAYRVEGHPFPHQQSPTWREVLAPLNHFQFVTSGGCLDVLTPVTPQFLVAPMSDDERKAWTAYLGRAHAEQAQ